MFFSPRLLNYFVRKQILQTFPESKISLEKFVLKPNSFGLVNLKVEKQSVYEFNIKELVFYFNIVSLIKREFKCEINGGFVNSDFDKAELPFDEKNSHSKLKTKRVNLKNLKVKLKKGSFDIDLDLDYAEIIPQEELIKRLSLRINSLNFLDFKLENAFLEINEEGRGGLEVKKINYGRINLETLKGNIYYKNNSFSIFPLKVKFLDGYIEGEVIFNLEKGFNYVWRLKFLNPNLERIIEALNYKDKFYLTGKLIGDLFLEGYGFDLKVIKGNLSFTDGGNLTIKDTKLARKIAEKSGQSFDIILNGLKDYRFDKGAIKISLEGNILLVKVFLEGDKGKRDLEVRWHGFKIGR